MREIILASGSPRRKQILEQIGLTFKVFPSDVEEIIEPQEDICRLVEQLALMKAEDVARKVIPGSLVIGADTVVASERGILGKPVNEEEAFDMLNLLSGRTHTVLTGIAVVDILHNKKLVSHEKTEVIFRPVSEREIWAYINTGEPMDKAGAYGIQGKGALFVERINGCYFNVVGLPVSRLYAVLREFGVEVLA